MVVSWKNCRQVRENGRKRTGRFPLTWRGFADLRQTMTNYEMR